MTGGNDMVRCCCSTASMLAEGVQARTSQGLLRIMRASFGILLKPVQQFVHISYGLPNWEGTGSSHCWERAVLFLCCFVVMHYRGVILPVSCRCQPGRVPQGEFHFFRHADASRGGED